MMRFHSMGLNIRHIGDFKIDRPDGSGDNLLIIFKTNALVEVNSEIITAPPESCILYRKNSKQLYKTSGKTYVNHYFHFDIDNENTFTSETGLKFDTLIKLNGSDEPERLLKDINKEQMSNSRHKDEYTSMLIKMLFMKIHDCSVSSSFMPEASHHIDELKELRADMYSNAGKYNSVEQLAKSINLSMSYFQQLYSEHFGISCYDDLLTSKIMMAQYYLSSSNLSVKVISELCGYKNDVCFMRRFKQRTGVTPTQYRCNNNV